jgi:hypothetical protein
MGISNKDRARFNELQEQADAALRLAREARAAVTAAYAACCRGDGTGPGKDQLERTAELEKISDEKAAFVRSMMQHLFW